MNPVPLSQARDGRVFGGKAVQLGAAIRAGLPVPEGFALAAELVAAIVRGETAACEELAGICASMQGPLAVRSSAIGEDSATASFAGQHATLLNVSGLDAVVSAVETVWRSAHSESALAYRSRMGADPDVLVGVVIQRLVAADVAGVLFTCNPVTGQDEIVIEATWGLGEAIVQGLVIPDRYRLARSGSVLGESAGFKQIAVRRSPEGLTWHEPVPGHLVDRKCLDADKLGSLMELVRRCDAHFGPGPHDIEWAIEGSDLRMLQLRPVSSRV